MRDTERWDVDDTPQPLQIKDEDDEPPVLYFDYCYEPEFDVRKKFVTYADLVYAVNCNKDHIFDYHLFKPKEVLLNETFFSGKPPKSVFLKDFSKNFILDLVEETLLDPNICVERQDHWTVLIRKRYAIIPNYIKKWKNNYKPNYFVLIVMFRNNIFGKLTNKLM